MADSSLQPDHSKPESQIYILTVPGTNQYVVSTPHRDYFFTNEQDAHQFAQETEQQLNRFMKNSQMNMQTAVIPYTPQKTSFKKFWAKMLGKSQY